MSLTKEYALSLARYRANRYCIVAMVYQLVEHGPWKVATSDDGTFSEEIMASYDWVLIPPRRG